MEYDIELQGFINKVKSDIADGLLDPQNDESILQEAIEQLEYARKCEEINKH